MHREADSKHTFGLIGRSLSRQVLKVEDSLGALHWRAGLELVARICSMSGKGQGTLSSTVCLLWSQRSSSSPAGLECALGINLLGWPLGPCPASPLPKG